MSIRPHSDSRKLAEYIKEVASQGTIGSNQRLGMIQEACNGHEGF